MKTLQIVGNSQYGGATYLVIKWCNYLVTKGWHVDVLSTDNLTLEKLSGIRDLGLISDIYIPREVSICRDISALCKISKLIAQNSYDVVHTYTATPGFIGRLAAKICRVNNIYHHQAGWTIGDFSTDFENFVYKKLEWFAASISTKSICVGEGVAQEARKCKFIPENNITVIKNGIDPDPFILCTSHKDEFCNEIGIPNNSFIVTSTSRFSKQKDVNSLVRAMAIMRKKYPISTIKLLLVGNGPEKENLHSLVVDLDLQDYVLFLGFREDVPRILHCSDVMVSTTLREGLSISILEAMAAAKPIVATDILQNQELIENEITGLTVPVHSPEQVATAIYRFMNDPDLAENCGNNARQRVLNEYSINRMFEQTYQLYVTAGRY